jgi:hypothetical protein
MDAMQTGSAGMQEDLKEPPFYFKHKKKYSRKLIYF